MKKTTLKKVRCIGLILLLIALIFGGNYLLQVAAIGAGYKAKILASGIFVSGRNADSVLREDLSATVYQFFDVDIDSLNQSVTASTLLGLVKSRASFRPGLGVTLHVQPEDRSTGLPAMARLSDELLWPQGEAVNLSDLPAEVDSVKLNQAIDHAFSEPDSTRLRRTRAVVVAYKGRIVAERYADCFNKDTPLLGWSMTKSVINALAGILVGQGKLSLDAPLNLPEWQKPDDPRRAITLDHLLRMNSGLKFHEQYTTPKTDVSQMLFVERDAAAFAANKPRAHPPGETWHYSSGTTNIIARLLKHALAGTDADYLRFPGQALFGKIGMTGAVLEPDAAGTFVGSSFMYATARDWARFGQLYLQDGVWQGERILPEGWVGYSTSPTKASRQWKYGAHFWINPKTPNGQWMPALPADLFFCWGHESQHVFIIPSRNLVLVRLGLSIEPTSWDFKIFAAEVLDAFPK
ncbi:MAG: serine hydrolase domain-containing protein [Candidatus Zhuqueibacterota bacterium]